MNALVKRLVESLVVAVAPRVLEIVIKAVEEVVRVDLDKDGQIGMAGKE